MRQPWLYFCYPFDVSILNSFTLSISYVICHSVFSDDIKVYRDSIFAYDIWFSIDIEFLTIPCVSHDSIFCYRFDASVVNSLKLSIPYVGCHLVFYDDFDYSDNSMRQPWLYFCYRFDASVLNSLTLSLSIGWWFHGLQWLYFRWRFVDPSWHSVFDNYMRQPWLYFCYRFHTSVVTHHSLTITRSTVTLFSLMIYRLAVTLRFWQFLASVMTLFLLLIWCVGSEFSDAVNSICQLSLSIHWRFQGLQWPSFRWRFMDQPSNSFLTIPCTNHEFIFAVNLMPLSWIHWRCRLHTSVVTHYLLMISRSTVTVFADDLWIICHIAFLTIPFVSHESIFAIDSMCRSWNHLRCRLHASAVTHRSLTIDYEVYSDFVFAVDLWISKDITFLTIPCVNLGFIFAIDLMRRSWIR